MSADLVVALRTERASYPPGAAVEATLAVRNEGTAPATLVFPSARRFDLELVDDAGQIAWRWGAGRTFAQALHEETLAPGGERAWTATVPLPERVGRYELRGAIVTIDRRLAAARSLEVDGGSPGRGAAGARP